MTAISITHCSSTEKSNHEIRRELSLWVSVPLITGVFILLRWIYFKSMGMCFTTHASHHLYSLKLRQYHSRLIPMYNARFILWPPSFSSPYWNMGRERRWPLWIKRRCISVSSDCWQYALNLVPKPWGWVLKWLYPESKVHGTNMGPTWALSAPDGPYVGPMNLVIRVSQGS